MIRTVPVLAAALCASPALAQSYADLGAVDRAVAAFTGAAQGAPGGAALPVDRRLRLAPCPAGLTLGWYGVRQDTVEVRCPVASGVGSARTAISPVPAQDAAAVAAITMTIPRFMLIPPHCQQAPAAAPGSSG